MGFLPVFARALNTFDTMALTISILNQPAIDVMRLGYLSLVLQRCVLIEAASEDLRVAGLRAANVFMARSAKASERRAPSAPGATSMDWRGTQDAESGVGSTSLVKPRDSMHFQGEL